MVYMLPLLEECDDRLAQRLQRLEGIVDVDWRGHDSLVPGRRGFYRIVMFAMYPVCTLS